MNCISDANIYVPSFSGSKVVAGFIGFAAISTIALAIIGLTATSSGPFGAIVQFGATAHKILLGVSLTVLFLDSIWIIALWKKEGTIKEQGPLPSEHTESNSFIDAIQPIHDKKLKSGLSGVYVLTNEVGVAKTIQEIEQLERTSQGERCHLGVGALHNFDIMAARRSDCGIIFDFNPENRKFINQSLELIKTCNTPAEFVENISLYMNQDIKKYNRYAGYASPIDRMRLELNTPSSWLWREDQSGKFQYIKNLAINGKIIAITQDFCRDQTFKQIDQILKARGCSIDTLYLSNLYVFLPIEDFYKTFDILTESKPLVIHCTPPASCHCEKGCQCPKQQHIGREWEKVDTKQGGLKTSV